MKTAPIVHTRLFQCDYPSNLLVRPSAFTNDEIQWARKYILNATDDSDSMRDKARWLIVKEDNKFMVGIVCTLETLFDQCKFVDKNKKNYQQYFHDTRGRRTFSFLGFMLEDAQPVVLSYENFWNIFEQYVKPYWNVATVNENDNWRKTDFSPFIPDVGGQITGKTSDAKCEILENGIRVYSDQINAQELFTLCLQEACNTDQLTFCSNLPFDSAKQFYFKIISANNNDLFRLKEHLEQEKKAHQQNQTQRKHYWKKDGKESSESPEDVADTSSNILSPQIKIAIAVAVVAITATILIYMLTKH